MYLVCIDSEDKFATIFYFYSAVSNASFSLVIFKDFTFITDFQQFD